ncbi:MAG: hypothetical protein JSV16_02535, partial [Candidatus Hydrogenedentota bacterium]
MKKQYELRNDGGTPQLNEEEKKAIVDEFTTKAKADIMKEMQAEVDKIVKLIADERKAHEDLLKGRITEADFKAYQDKSHTEEEAIKTRLDDLETKMDRPPAPGPGEDKGDEDPSEEMKAFMKYVR